MSKIKNEGFIPVSKHKIWYKIVGKKKKIPLLVLHGGPGFPHNYLTPLEDLGDEREVIFYDQLGCGKSERPDDMSLWTVERFVSELEGVIKWFSLKRYHMLGQSWGAALAVCFALKKPSGLVSLILANPYLSSPLWMKDAKRLKKLLPKYIQKILKKHEDAGTTDSKEYLKATKVFNDRFVRRLKSIPRSLTQSKKGMGHLVYNTMWGPDECFVSGNLRGFDLTDKLSHISLPVLLLCGRYDEATPESTRYFQSLVPTAQMKIFESSAHLPFLSERRDFIKTVREFLQKENRT